MRWPNQRGDTLVEVIFALIILSAVLIGTLSLARFSRLNSQNSQARTQAINLVQEQYEALKEFRDSVNWAQFAGGTSGSFGITLVRGYGGCAATPGSNCVVHMERDPRATISGLPNPHYGQWTVCPGSWFPPIDYDATTSTTKSWSADPYCGHTNTGQTTISVGINLLGTPPSCPGTEVDFYTFNIYANWAQGGFVSSSTTNLETMLANIRGQSVC